ncbi:DUF1330 domain-containing protein [Mangrovimonas sp. YM274]|uniref:DUF1330 domain-containing protein n=1 Tax=Mangrovimonas sp. YM274 TaxID=3070660 RepID=UPI0027DC8250|nr:DUF1330 domain-containing protein [Mangrovimonas sp. YM274]WMI67771.1 DUF1330 domain-containing protein [Mangrovimonas sp. YM274]
MEAYFIISYDIVDFETFQNYPPAVWEILQQYGGELLVSDTEAVVIEGNRKMMHSIIKFPSQEIAMECFNSEEYQSVRPFRINSTKDNTVILAKAFNPNT